MKNKQAALLKESGFCSCLRTVINIAAPTLLHELRKDGYEPVNALHAFCRILKRLYYI